MSLLVPPIIRSTRALVAVPPIGSPISWETHLCALPVGLAWWVIKAAMLVWVCPAMQVWVFECLQRALEVSPAWEVAPALEVAPTWEVAPALEVAPAWDCRIHWAEANKVKMGVLDMLTEMVKVLTLNYRVLVPALVVALMAPTLVFESRLVVLVVVVSLIPVVRAWCWARLIRVRLLSWFLVGVVVIIARVDVSALVCHDAICLQVACWVSRGRVRVGSFWFSYTCASLGV